MEMPIVDQPKKISGKILSQRILLIMGIVLGFGLFGVVGYYFGLGKSMSGGKNIVYENTIVNSVVDTVVPTPDTICGIEKFRLSEPITFGDMQYFIFKRNSMNVYIPEGNENYLESGVFVADDKYGNNCKKIINILDESPAKNNVYDFYADNDSFYVMAVDQFGGGSGEGNAKILKSDDDGKSWEVKYCYYYTPEIKVSIKDFISGTQGNIELKSLDNHYCKDFILGVSGGRLKIDKE